MIKCLKSDATININQELSGRIYKSKPIKYVLKVSNNSHQSFEEYPIIFKKGDDLRKDHVMLQIIKLIQKVF